MLKYSLIVLLLCSSCSASYHIKKAMRKDPSLFKADTVSIVDTVRVVTQKVDTAFIQQTDTLIQFIQQDDIGQDIKIKYLYSTITDSVFIEVDCPDQQTIVKTEVVTKTVTIKPTFFEKIRYLLIGIGILLFILLVFKIFK